MHKLGEYKGNPTITLTNTPEDKYPFTFGVNKARLLLANLEAVKQFVADNEKKETGGVK